MNIEADPLARTVPTTALTTGPDARTATTSRNPAVTWSVTRHPATAPTSNAMDLPTAPHSVVWSRGHCYVREGTLGRARWVGVDDRGRPQSLTDADLHRRGWTFSRA